MLTRLYTVNFSRVVIRVYVIRAVQLCGRLRGCRGTVSECFGNWREELNIPLNFPWNLFFYFFFVGADFD